MGIEFEKFMNFYPKDFSERSNMTKHILKEYVELLSLSFISSSQYVSKLSFIGGTNLRLVKRIDRFSEDLDFDCKNMSHDEFIGQKGRDFYDSMFLLQQTKPDFNFLKVKCGIDSFNALEKRLNEVLEKVDLNVKEKDFEHLLFFPNGASSIHGIKEFIHALNKKKPLDFSEGENQNIVSEEKGKYRKL